LDQSADYIAGQGIIPSFSEYWLNATRDLDDQRILASPEIRFAGRPPEKIKNFAYNQD
jgi:hypothetical protein